MAAVSGACLAKSLYYNVLSRISPRVSARVRWSGSAQIRASVLEADGSTVRRAFTGLFGLLVTCGWLGLGAVTVQAAPPVVTVLAPNGSEVLQGGSVATVNWTATDDGTITRIDLYYLDEVGADWTQVAAAVPNTGTFTWFVHNTPSTTARFRVVATDNSATTGEDQSNADFTILQVPGGFVPTTLRDFEQPGTQPFGGGTFSPVSFCAACHSGYDQAVEPGFNYNGSMMAQAARDPLFFACVAIAEQDVPSSGDLCIRCHSPSAWLQGRSNPTDGSALTAADRDGVSCDFCHSMVDPVYAPGVSPIQDVAILEALDEVPTSFGNGQYVVDPGDVRRGPYADPAAPHAWLRSPFHRESDLCGTCHNVSNPAFDRVAGHEYEANPFDEPAGSIAESIILPVERTYSEWLHSDYPAGVYQPEFAGAKPDGIVSSCQDCHMRDVVGKGCGLEFAPTRSDLPLHDFTGGNVWMPPIIAQIYPGEVDLASLQAASARARDMLEKATLLDVAVAADGDSFRAVVTVTNRSGHKFPTGYAEGRRAWINVRAFDAGDALVYESAAYDWGTAELTHDEDARIYEIEMGISHRLAAVTGLPAGPSFHFVLNDSIFKDNRIPPAGFDNANYEIAGAAPVDPDWSGPGDRYPDGQNWDVAIYGLPSTTAKVISTLYYQTVSKEYIEFLRDENTTNSAGDDMFTLWMNNSKAPPVEMIADTSFTVPTDVPEVPAPRDLISVVAGPNPFSKEVAAHLALPRAMPIRMEVYDTQGRRKAVVERGLVGAGSQRLVWDGRDTNGNDAGSGIFWLRVFAGNDQVVRRVVRLK